MNKPMQKAIENGSPEFKSYAEYVMEVMPDVTLPALREMFKHNASVREYKASLVGLSQDDRIVTRASDVNQHVPMPASEAQEVSAVLVNLGGNGSEHDCKAAVPTGPHVPDATSGPAAYGVHFITNDDGVDPWDDIYSSIDTAREVAHQRTMTGVDGDRWEVVALYSAPVNAELMIARLRSALHVMVRDYKAVHGVGDLEMQPALYQANAALGWQAANTSGVKEDQRG